MKCFAYCILQLIYGGGCDREAGLMQLELYKMNGSLLKKKKNSESLYIVQREGSTIPNLLRNFSPHCGNDLKLISLKHKTDL